jgi:hypothetical protein
MKKQILSMWDLLDEIYDIIEKHTKKIKEYDDGEGNRAYLGETLNNYTIAIFISKNDADVDSIKIEVEIEPSDFRGEWKEWCKI